MVSLGIYGVGSYLAAGSSYAGLIQVGTALAASAAYAYVDQPYIIPALFGEDSPKDQNKIGNITLPTTNPGEPRYRVFGREAYVPGHFLWIKDQKVLTTTSGSGGSGKGATALSSVSERFADIGVAACDGPIMNIVSAMASRSVFYGERSSSASVFSDSRVDMYSSATSPYYGTAANSANWTAANRLAWFGSSTAEIPEGVLTVLVNPSYGVTELMGDHFDAGDVVEIFSIGEGDELFESSAGSFGIRTGVYAVFFVGRDVGAQQDYISLVPLAAQAVNAIPGGVLRESTEPEPVIIRRIDECICGYTTEFNRPFPVPVGAAMTFMREHNNNPLHPSFDQFGFYVDGIGGDPEEVLMGVEVFGSHGGFTESNNGGSPVATEVEIGGFTKLSKQRLKEGNVYELQGFCDIDGNNSDRTLVASLHQISAFSAQAGQNDIAPPINNPNYVAGEKYRLWFKCYKHELQDIIDSLPGVTASIPGGYTDLFPGNGQFTPYHTDTGLTSPSNVNLGSVADLTTTPGSPTTDFTNPKVTIGDADLIERTGGAEPANKGGLGDVGFCILPPRSGDFSYRSSNTGTAIGQQVAEFNDGNSSQEPLTNSDGIAHRGLAHISFLDLNLYQFGNTMPQVSFKVREAESRTVGDIVSKLVDSVAPYGSVLPGFSSGISAYGYSVAGGTPVKQAIQPLAVAFGFSMQERAGKMAMLQDSELPVVNVPITKLNARSYGGADGLMRGLQITQIDSDDLPQRVLVKYRAIATGNEEARAAGIRSPGSEEAGRRDTIEYNLRPLVMTDGFAKARAQQLLDKSRTESSTSHTVLPPSRMDVLPGHVISTSSNSGAATTPDATTTTSVGLTDRKGDVVPGSVSVPLRFLKVSGSFGGGDYSEEVLSCTLVDDANGSMVGEPDGITITSTVDYDASGQWLLVTVTTANTTIIDPDRVAIRYEYEVSRTFRATKATLSGVDFTVSTPLVSTAHDHVFPVHQHRITRELLPTPAGAIGTAQVFAVDDPTTSGPWGGAPEIGLAIVAPGAGGATIYESADGVSDWSEIGQVFGSAYTFSLTTILEPDGTEAVEMPAWSDDNTIESRVDYALSLVLDGGFPAEMSGDVTLREVYEGKHNFYIDGEVIGAIRVSVAGNQVVLQGLVRCLRGTRYASRLHVPEMTVIYLPPGDGTGIAHIEPSAGFAGVATTRYLRAVLPGSTLALTDTSTVETRGTRALPGAAVVSTDSIRIDESNDDVVFSWDRPAYMLSPVFGMPSSPTGYFEQYEVYAFEATEIDDTLSGVALDEDIISKSKAVWFVGDQSSQIADRSIVYTAAQQLSDGFIAGDKLALMVFPVSPAGRGPRCWPSYDDGQIVVTATS